MCVPIKLVLILIVLLESKIFFYHCCVNMFLILGATTFCVAALAPIHMTSIKNKELQGVRSSPGAGTWPVSSSLL